MKRENLKASVSQVLAVAAAPIMRRAHGMDLHSGYYTVTVKVKVEATSPAAACLHVERVLHGHHAMSVTLGEAKPAFEERP